MIKNTLFIGLTFFSFSVIAQNFSVTYGFPNVSTTTGSVDPGPAPQFKGVMFGSFKAVGVSPNPNASGRFSFTNWPLGATNGVNNYTAFTGKPDSSAYFELQIMPVLGYTLNLDNISFGMRRSGTGIRNYCVRSGFDNFVSNISAGTGSNSKIGIVNPDVFFWKYDSVNITSDQKGSIVYLDSNFKNLTDTITFRFYAWNSEAKGGSFSIDNVNIMGSAYNVPPDLTGIPSRNYKEQPLIVCYPNPFKDILVIKSTETLRKVEMYASIGIMWYSQIVNEKETSLSFPLYDLPAGIYTLKVLTGSSGIYYLSVIKGD
jgi:hypothetical protein